MNHSVIDRPVSSADSSIESGSATAGAGEKRRPIVSRVVLSVFESIPTLLVLAALGGIAWWGHNSNWQIPKFSQIAGTGGSESEEWCEEHGVPESECIACIPALLATQTDFGWCHDHGIHQCPLCHPEVAELKTKPVVDSLWMEKVSYALGTLDRQENNPGCLLYRNRVQFSTVEAVAKAGVDVELAEIRPVVESITANGEITYDETKVAHLAPRLSGTVWKVIRNTGDQVRKGDVLALIDAADVGKAKSELLDALAQSGFHSRTLARLAPLADREIIAGNRMLEAETALEQANIRLRRAEQTLMNLGLHIDLPALTAMPESDRAAFVRFVGIPDDIRTQLSESTTSNNLFPMVASIDGTVVERSAVSGEFVDPSKMLFQLADTTNMWMRFNVALEDAAHLSTGQSVRFLPDGMRNEVGGSIQWISTSVDQGTRTVEVRAGIDNTAGKLRNETFGLGRIILRETDDAVTIPKDAVQWDGSCFVVFVRDRNYFEEGHPKLFHTRTVRPGVTKDGFTEIIAGVLPGEVVVTKGSSVLRSQILKNSLGAGCTCGH